MFHNCKHIINLFFLFALISFSSNATVVETLTSGDASIQVVKTDENTYKLSFLYDGNVIPTINPDNTVYLEVTGNELSGTYSSYNLSGNRLTCSASLTSSRGSIFSVSDVYLAKGNGVIELQRKVEISNAKTGDRYFNSLFGFRADENGTRLGKNDYFVPSVWYKSNFTATGNLPGHLPQVDDTYFYYRDDRTPLPVLMFRVPNTGFTLTLIHKDSECETVIADGNGIYIGEDYQFGAVGIKRENNIIYANFIYPGSEANRSDGKGYRYHPVKDGISHAYNLEICFSTTADYNTAVTQSWNHAFDLYNPTIYTVDLTETYKGLIETLIYYYGANTAMGGIYDAPGWPFEVNLSNFQASAYNYQMGFVGMQVATGYYIYREGIETDDNSMKSKGEAVLDFWATKSLTELGLPRIWYDPGTYGNTGSFRGDNTFRSATGGMESLIAAWCFAKRNGIDRPDWIDACKKFGDWLVTNQNSDGSYYFAYNHNSISNGKHPASDTNKFTTICAVRYLVELYIATENEEYKEAALKAGDWCYQNIHTKYTYVASVVDNPRTIDSESGQMALNGFLSLYDLTKEQKWLNATEQAATYTESWTYCFEIPVEKDKGSRPTTFPRDRSIVGQHIIAIGHSGADLGFAWSSFAYYRLYLETGNEHYLKVARIAAHNSKQSMNWDGSLFPGRPRGLQMEVFNVNGLRRESGVFTCLNWNYAAHLDPMFRFKDAFGTPDLEKVEEMTWRERMEKNFIYSQVQSANWGQDVEEYNSIKNTNSGQKLSVYPNPVSQNSNVYIHVPDSQTAWGIQLIDMLGRPLLSQTLASDRQILSMDINGIANGQYLLVLKGDKEQLTSKLIIQ